VLHQSQGMDMDDQGMSSADQKKVHGGRVMQGSAFAPVLRTSGYRPCPYYRSCKKAAIQNFKYLFSQWLWARICQM